MFPYYAHISFPLTKTKAEIDGTEKQHTPFLDSIIDNKYTDRFLKTLKEVFGGEISSTPLTISRNIMSMNYISSSEGDTVDHDAETNQRMNVKRYDYFEFLIIYL